MASGQGSCWHIEIPTHNNDNIYDCIFRPLELFVDVVFKDATLPTAQGPLYNGGQ